MYNTMKLLIKYRRKYAEELIKYCDAYLASGKLDKKEYNELMDMIVKM
ncbi:MAG: hypothetical protein IJZ25_00825 [Lachnospiraceae bacterium]|nr:hypothetical protein [Lachnospiraceae bacterium]